MTSVNDLKKSSFYYSKVYTERIDIQFHLLLSNFTVTLLQQINYNLIVSKP
jgi:hypothetical protein